MSWGWDSDITEWIIEGMTNKKESNDNGTREDDKSTVDRDVQNSEKES